MGADVAHCVECYSGYTYAEYPKTFIYQERNLRVTEIRNRWQIPGGYLFRVIGSDDGCYELEYQVLPDCWQVRPF